MFQQTHAFWPGCIEKIDQKQKTLQTCRSCAAAVRSLWNTSGDLETASIPYAHCLPPAHTICTPVLQCATCAEFSHHICRLAHSYTHHTHIRTYLHTYFAHFHTLLHTNSRNPRTFDPFGAQKTEKHSSTHFYTQTHVIHALLTPLAQQKHFLVWSTHFWPLCHKKNTLAKYSPFLNRNHALLTTLLHIIFLRCRLRGFDPFLNFFQHLPES